MDLYFVRHGESTANRLHVFSNQGRKHPLTEAGRDQAHALAERLSDVPIGQIHTSPVLRAKQTARILAKRLHAPIRVTEALREWSVGVYEGTIDPAGWELHRRVQEQWFDERNEEARMPGGESFREMRARFVPFIDRLIAAQDGRDAVLVAHGGLYLAMLPVILINIDHAFARRHGFPCTGMVTAEARADGLFCRSWCGVVPGVGSEDDESSGMKTNKQSPYSQGE